MSVFIATVAKRNRAGILAFTALAALASTSSGAWATCGTPVQTLTPINNLQLLSIPPSAAGAAIAGAIANVDTVFLTQQGSAFVSAPGNPQPNQPGGGVWGRAIGGEANVNTSSVSQSNFVNNNTGAVVNTGTTACANNTSESFAGVQIGGDISRLNWNGWNLHLGTTAGYLGSRERDDNGFSNSFQVPFLGTYLVATHGRFFADMMVREEFYNVNLNNPGLNYFSQPVGAHGFSVSTSAGYNFDLHKGWFVEPSAGFIYSRTSVDSFVNPGTAALPVPGLVTTNDIESEIGRLSLRVGRTIETPKVVWQPFASASVFHEFGGNVVTNYASLPNSVILQGGPFGGGVPATFSQSTSTSRIGTYGQYSLGIAGQVVNTGWLGFARVDYRDGGGINGWTGNLGIRYQFTPEMIAAVMPYKVKAPPHPYLAPTNWTGFYVGGVAGAAAGRTDFQFPAAPFPIAGNRPHVFGGLGGIELGYNKQFSNNWVLGVEGDIAAANVRGGGPAGSSNGLPALTAGGAFSSNNFGFSPAFYTVQDRTNWMGTVTGRVGYSWGRTLFYAKGGAAFEDSSLSASCIYGPVVLPYPPNVSRYCVNVTGAATSAGWSTPSFTRVGWTGGFGTEFDLGHNWSAKTEYDFLSFGRHTALANDGVTVMTDKSWISQVKVGVNYKFTPGMVVAKY